LKIFFFKLFSKFVSANHILQNFLSAENFPEWKWAFTFGLNDYPEQQANRKIHIYRQAKASENTANTSG
jgi:hypothetical protein